MKKSSFLIIVAITGIALAGVIFIQFFWIRSALLLQEEQFDSRVRLALKGAVNQMYEIKSDTGETKLFCNRKCVLIGDRFASGISIRILDSLVHVEFEEAGLEEPYVYGVFSPEAKKSEFVSDTVFEKQLLGTPHLASLSCIMKDNPMLLGAWFPDEKGIAIKGIFWWLLLCGVLLVVLVFGFIFNIYSFLKQKKISEMKSDFVNNITHEFKTPIATISLASEMLLKPSVLASETKARKYAGIIYDENLRLKNQVEHVLQLAVLDRGSYHLNQSSFDLHQLLQKTTDSFQIIVKERNGNLKLHLDSSAHQVFADSLHIENVIVNLLDNANKYSPEKPDITVSTFLRNDFIVVAIEDKGIGIGSKDQKNIFRKMFRVHTGNVHNVKGFGLGLFYVKTLVNAHNGEVFVHSEPGKGSRFEISLPLDYLNPATKTP